MKNLFTPAQILLPDLSPNDPAWEKWSVIACDQFTSEIEYWESAERIVDGALSTLDYILPEAYLETPRAQEAEARIKRKMNDADECLKRYENSMIYVERTLPDGKVRKGIVGKIDLQEYDFTDNPTAAVRATEKTVVERIPPRVAVRKEATIEFPHVMLFADDAECPFIAPLSARKQYMEKVYDFPLMLGGGSIVGYRICGDELERLEKAIGEYEKSRGTGAVYAVGDGNHSLASAKTHYENIKKELGAAAENHPARYALVETVSLSDESIAFEPIYRILKNCDTERFFALLSQSCDEGKRVSAITCDGEREVTFPDTHPLTVGALQQYIDDYIGKNPDVVCDYIHGEEALKNLSGAEKAVGFLFEGIRKDELFDYVTKNGVLPRKTFSMGEAKSKRYYLEARKIVR